MQNALCKMFDSKSFSWNETQDTLVVTESETVTNITKRAPELADTTLVDAFVKILDDDTRKRTNTPRYSHQLEIVISDILNSVSPS